MMAKQRRLTATEQNKLLEDFYTHVYAEDLPFHGHDNQIHFENEEEIADEQLLDEESGKDEPEHIIDENIDTDISKDESESHNDDVVLPRKQTCSCQKDLLDDSKYEKPPDQKSRTFGPTKEEIV